MAGFHLDDTIAAVSTAMAPAGIGIVRISGNDAFEVADRVFRAKKEGKKLSAVKSHTIHYGWITEGEEVIDEVLVMVMKGPKTYTGENTVEIDYHEVPNFPVSTAPGHAGKLMFGELAGKKLVCLAGRFHSYEGYDFEQLTQPVRLLKLLGVRALIVTNAAGGVNLAYHRGDFMLIADHIKLNGSIELAPILGLSDVIVDIVETGTTLRENGLRVVTEFMPISARFIANKASYQFKHREMDEMLKKLRAALAAKEEKK